jgi:hypothetical protein
VTAPDVIVLGADGGFYDATVRAWNARKIRPLIPETAPRPLHHADDCCYRHNPDLVEVCPCTRRQRDYRARHPH